MMDELTDTHELQLQSFLRFSSLKLQQHQREILQCVGECEENIHAGEMYSSSDVRVILDGLRQELQKYISKEVENAYHSSALLIKLQLVQAQQARTSIFVDTNQLENETLLQQIRACERAAMSRPAADFAVKRAGVLGGLGGAGVRTVADSAVVQQREQLRNEVEALRSRLEALQSANSTAMSSKADLAEKLSQAQAELVQVKGALQQSQKAAAGAGADAGAKAIAQQAAAAQAAQATAESAQQQLVILQQQLKTKEAQAKAAEQALSGKLQDSKQWQQMRQLMQAKSQEVVTLRKQLAKYEPQDVPSADAAAAVLAAGDL